MVASLGFGPIRDDDELLDRLGARLAVDDNGLGDLLASWTRDIDDDCQRASQSVGPFGLSFGGGRGGGLPPGPPVRTVRLKGSRALAIMGAVALTLSGGGVAAALNGNDVPPLTRLAGFAAGESADDVTSRPTSAANTERQQWTDWVARAQRALDAGQVQRAEAIVELAQENLAQKQLGADLENKVADLQEEILKKAGVPVSPTTVPMPTPGVPSPSTGPAWPTPPTPAPVPSAPSTTAPQTPEPSPTPSTPQGSEPTSGTPSTSPSTSPGSLGTAGGEQTGGREPSTKPTSDASPRPSGDVSPTPSVTPPAPPASATPPKLSITAEPVPTSSSPSAGSKPSGSTTASPSSSRASSTPRDAETTAESGPTPTLRTASASSGTPALP